MRLRLYQLALVVLLTWSSNADGRSDCPPWSYFGTNGPQTWGYLCPTYSTCGTSDLYHLGQEQLTTSNRQEQSPINIDPEESAVDYSLGSITFNYLPLPTPATTQQKRDVALFRTKQDTPTTAPGTGGSWAYSGHAVQLNRPPGDYITGGPMQDKQYNLVQLHFHAPQKNDSHVIHLLAARHIDNF